MLVRRDNAIFGQTQRWRAALNSLGFSLVGLVLVAPLATAWCYDGPRALHNHEFLYLTAPMTIASLVLFWIALQVWVRKAIQPDKLTLTFSDLTIIRSGRRKTFAWSDLGEMRAHDDARGGGSVQIKDLTTGNTLHINMSGYGCRGDEFRDIIQSVRAGRLMDSYDWRAEHDASQIPTYVIMLIIAAPLVTSAILSAASHFI